jgi:Tfp pilus assembly protein PilE
MRSHQVNKSSSQFGLIRIEVIIAWAIVALITYVTIPAIGAFTGRAQGVEPHTLMKPVHIAVNKYLQQHGQCPAPGIAALGVSVAEGRYTENVRLEAGCVIKASFKADAREKIADKEFAWYAGADTEGNIHWACGTAEPPALGSNPRIKYAAGPADTTADYAPWLPTRCHPPRPLDQRKSELVLFFERILG